MERMSMNPESIAGLPWLHKVIALLVALLAPVVAFILGLQVLPLDPLDPHRDLVRRLMGCAVASLVFGLPTLAYIHHGWPWLWDEASTVTVRLGLDSVGGYAITWACLLVTALPGWWVVGAVMRKLASWKGKSINEIASDARATVAEVIKP